MTPDDYAWAQQAECHRPDDVDAHYHNNLFFPDSNDHVRDGRRFCRVCPVVSECLEFALATNQSDGIWGNTTETERRRIKRHRRLVSSEVTLSRAG